MNTPTREELTATLETLSGELRVLSERLAIPGRGPESITKAAASRWAADLAKLARDTTKGPGTI